MRKYIVIKVWEYASPSFQEWFDTLEDARAYAAIFNRQKETKQQNVHYEVFVADQA